MTSDGAATECFVYITLPGAIEPVTAGRFVQERQRSGMTLGRFVYGRSYLARQDAVVLAPVELKLSDRTYEGGILLNSSATQRHRGRYFRQSAQICKMRDVTRGWTLHNFNL